MQDIRQAIAVAGNPAASSADRNAALEYCNSVKCSAGAWLMCCNLFRTCDDASARFWCLSSLLDIVQNTWASLDSESQMAIRAFVLEYMRQQVSAAHLDPHVFILNKFGQLVAGLVACSFPQQWPDFFEAMLDNLSAAPSPATVDMFLRVMGAVDEDIICGGLDFPRESYQAAMSMQVKDGLRESSISRIFDAWMTIICQCGDSNANLTCTTLGLVGAYISWADIGLVVNEKVLPVIFRCCAVPALMPDALKCLAAVVSKKMEYSSKISVMLQINVPAALQQLTSNRALAEPYAPFVAAICKETVACINKSLEDASLNAPACASAQLLNIALPCLIDTLQSCSDASAEVALELLKEFVALLKKVGALPDADKVTRPQLDGFQHLDSHLQAMLTAICSRLCLPLDFDFDESVGDDNADNGYRQDLLTVYKSIARLRPQNARVFVINLLATAARDAGSWNRCEVAVLLFFEMGEVFPTDTSKAGEGDVASTMQMLLEAHVWDWPAPQLQSTVMETVLRYFRFFAAAPAYLPPVLAAFTGIRGIQSPSEALRRRAAYLFMKFCKMISKHDPKRLADVLTHVCAAVLPVFEAYLTQDGGKIADHDTRVQCAEALGIVIGSCSVPLASKVTELSRFITPFTLLLAHMMALNLPISPDQHPNGDVQKWIDRTGNVADVISSVCKGAGMPLCSCSTPCVKPFCRSGSRRCGTLAAASGSDSRCFAINF
jgi:exportin-T